MAGQFVWFDLSTEDVEGSKRFYGALLGWSAKAFAPGYDLLERGAEGFGGIMPLAAEAKQMGAPPNWMGYASVDDVDAACGKAGKLGGRVIVPATDIPGTGRFAILADPTGAVIAAFSSANPGPPPKAVAWSELASADPATSLAFLQAMFGWSEADRLEMPGGGVYQLLKGDGEAFAGLSKSQPGMPSAWAFYFACTDCRATFAQAVSAGCRELYAPMQVPGGGWSALLVDPQGAAFGLFSM